MKIELQNKPSRSRYFKIFIHLGISGTKASLWASDATLIDALKVTKFVEELFLEKVLYELEIEGHGKWIKLNNFSGQLERDEKGVPYWKIIIETTAVTTSHCIGRAISNKLFHTDHKVDSSIKVRPINNFEEIQKK